MGAIGRLGLAILGKSIGGPWGGLVGSIVGSLLFPDKVPDQHSEGPRLTDLTLTTSAFGVTIPWVWGQYLVPGNIIWMGDVHEHAHTTEEDISGKGGGGGTYSQTDYTYTVSMAVALCKGPMHKVVKIFMANQLVYDALGGTLQKEIPGLRWRFYPGSETQLPDSIIEAKEGVGNVPGFRGLSYVVFDELDITEFGNAPPQMQFVVQDAGTETYVNLPLTQQAGNPSEFFVDFARGLKHHVGNGLLETVDLYTQKTILATPLPATLNRDWTYSQIVGLTRDGDIVMLAWGPTRLIYARTVLGIVNPFTHTVVQESGQTAEFVAGFGPQSAAIGQYTALDQTTRRTVVLMGLDSFNYGPAAIWTAGYEISATQRLIPLVDESWGSQASKYICSFYTLRHQNATDVEFFWLHQDVDDSGYVRDRIVLSSIRVTDAASVVQLGGAPSSAPAVDVHDIMEFGVADFDPDGDLTSFKTYVTGFGEPMGPRGSFVDGMLYDEYTDTLVISVMTKRYLLKLQLADDGDDTTADILWRATTKAGIDTLGQFVWRDGTITNNATLAVEHGGGTQIIDLNTGEERTDVSIASGDGPTIYTTDAYSASGVLVVYPNMVQLLDQAGPGRIPVARIIQDVSEVVGQPANDYAGISDLYVLGYACAKVTDARSIIDPLATTFNFDGVDAGGYMRWVKRGAPSVATVSRGDMIVVDDDTGSVLDVTRAQDVELPQSVSVSYADADRNYETVTYYRQRFAGNEGYETTRSANQVNVEIPAAIDPDVAKQAADIILMSLWNGRNTQKLKLPPWAMLFDAGDVVTLDIPDRFPEDVRIGTQTIGADMTVEIESSSQDSSQYVSLVTADPGQSYGQPVFTREMFTRLYLLPVPYLRDENDNGLRTNLTTYYGMGALRDGWASGTMQRKPGDAPWLTVGSLDTESPHGILLDALAPSDPRMTFAFQPRESMRVRLVHGELQSVTYDQLMLGANAAAILQADDRAEVIQFREAVLEEDGTYTLSGLLRGRRGTDYWAQTYEAPAGTGFVLLGQKQTGATAEPLASLGVVRKYRAFGANQTPEQGDERSIKLLGTELRPYAPVHLAVDEDSSDLVLTWTRRSRVRGELRNLTPDVPLEEDAEAYVVRVIDTGLDKTYQVSDPTFTYTAAMQGEDGFSGMGTFEVWQLSAQVGDGFPTQINYGVLAQVAQASVFAIQQLPVPDAQVAQADVYALTLIGYVRVGVAQANVFSINRLDHTLAQVAQHFVTVISKES